MRNQVDSNRLERPRSLRDKVDNNDNDQIYSSSYKLYESFHENSTKIYDNYLELRRPPNKPWVWITIGILGLVILILVVAIILILVLLVPNKNEGNALNNFEKLNSDLI